MNEDTPLYFAALIVLLVAFFLLQAKMKDRFCRRLDQQIRIALEKALSIYREGFVPTYQEQIGLLITLAALATRGEKVISRHILPRQWKGLHDCSFYLAHMVEGRRINRTAVDRVRAIVCGTVATFNLARERSRAYDAIVPKPLPCYHGEPPKPSLLEMLGYCEHLKEPQGIAKIDWEVFKTWRMGQLLLIEGCLYQVTRVAVFAESGLERWREFELYDFATGEYEFIRAGVGSSELWLKRSVPMSPLLVAMQSLDGDGNSLVVQGAMSVIERGEGSLADEAVVFKAAYAVTMISGHHFISISFGKSSADWVEQPLDPELVQAVVVKG